MDASIQPGEAGIPKAYEDLRPHPFRSVFFGFWFCMVPVSIYWLATGDWRVGAGGALVSAVIAVLGFGVLIAVRPVYLGVGILLACSLSVVWQVWSSHELAASLEELRENPMAPPQAFHTLSQIDNAFLAIGAVGLGFLAVCGVLGWVKLFRGLEMRRFCAVPSDSDGSHP
jgi:hypothetical protein